MTTAKERAKVKAEQEALESATTETVENTDEALSAASIIAIAAAEQEAEPEIKTDDEIRKDEEVSSIIYCGPSLRNNALQQYAVFTNELPIHVKEQLEKCPAINALIVPIGQLNTCVANIGTQGTAEQVMYEQIQAYVRGEQ